MYSFSLGNRQRSFVTLIAAELSYWWQEYNIYYEGIELNLLIRWHNICEDLSVTLPKVVKNNIHNQPDRNHCLIQRQTRNAMFEITNKHKQIRMRCWPICLSIVRHLIFEAVPVVSLTAYLNGL